VREKEWLSVNVLPASSATVTAHVREPLGGMAVTFPETEATPRTPGEKVKPYWDEGEAESTLMEAEEVTESLNIERVRG